MKLFPSFSLWKKKHFLLEQFCISIKNVINIACLEGFLLKDEDIFLLLVSHGRVERAVSQVNRRLSVIRCAVIPRVLIESQLSIFQHTVNVYPGFAEKCKNTHVDCALGQFSWLCCWFYHNKDLALNENTQFIMQIPIHTWSFVYVIRKFDLFSKIIANVCFWTFYNWCENFKHSWRIKNAFMYNGKTVQNNFRGSTERILCDTADDLGFLSKCWRNFRFNINF